jgi:EAL domain-containing protein (putative c-di-GMP-specific phosphodiesterase class I)
MDGGLLLAMAVALVASGLFIKLSQCRSIMLPLDLVGYDPVVRDGFAVMPAAMLTLLVFVAIKGCLLSLGFGDLQASLARLIVWPFANAQNNLLIALLYGGVSQILWFFGLHGPNLLHSVEASVLIPNEVANAAAFANGVTPEYIVTKTFIDTFTRIGGSGGTLSLILAIVFSSRDRGMRKLCLFAVVPSLFNVNEPLLFGVPLVLNPVYAVPFLLVPIVQTITAYLATIAGLVPKTVALVTWTSPPLLSGYLATKSMAGVMLQCVNIGLGFFVYLYFVKISDAIRKKNSIRIMQGLYQTVASTQSHHLRKCLDHPGEVGRLSKALAGDLEKCLATQSQLYMVYQPQWDCRGGRVSGVEALLRWRHPIHGEISPLITVALAEEAGLIDALGRFVLAEASEQRAAWSRFVPPGLRLSINVSPKQFLNPRFSDAVLAIIRNHELQPRQIELEITETSLLEPDVQILESLTQLQTQGIRVAIDDFGMGHASLRYLRAFPVDTVKLDRSLTDACENRVNEQIARSMLDLCRSLDIASVVEGVENEEQIDRFLSFGFHIFQGYHFSRPLPGEACLAYIRERSAPA